MSEIVIVFLVLFLPVIFVSGYVYLAKRRYESAKIHRKYRVRRK